jgi:DNA-binding beta-propeller fold protein YncE
VDSDGNVYIADWGNYRVRKVYTFGGVSRRMRRRGYITTIAGTGTSGYNGENILATGAQLLYPQSVAVDSAHNVFIGDSARIRKVSSADGKITTVAGNGNSGYNGDNIPAITAEVRDPNALAVDSANNLYVTEYNNERVRKISASTGLITTLAGTGANGYNGYNIAACAASLSGPNGVAVDSAGKVYIADEFNQRVRVLIPSTASCP